MNADDKRFDWMTERIIGCAFKVGNALGSGFLEKVYENALAHELRKAGLHVAQQVPIKVWYDGVVVGEYIADLAVEGVVIVELKAGKALDQAHLAQCINYLTATRMPVAILINFGKRVEFKRIAGPSLTSNESVSIGVSSVANNE